MSNIKRDYPLSEKRLWRCHVCLDIHFGKMPPYICPTCGAKGAFVAIDRSEALTIIGERGGAINRKEDVMQTWTQFSLVGKGFKLVDDEEMINGLAEGVIENLKNHGQKYCPCRITSGDQDADLKLVCPCHFEAQNVWGEKGECWCGLFKEDKAE